MIDIHHIGRPLNRPGWPQPDTIDGLLQALVQWDLDPALDYSHDPRFDTHPRRAPFRGPALRVGRKTWSQELGQTRYGYGDPIYPDHPDSVQFCGNFIGYSFGFSLATDEPELIQRLDAAIAANLERQREVEAVAVSALRPETPRG